MNKIGFCLLIPALLVAASSADAQDLRGRGVTTVQIQGLSQISEQLVRSQLEVQPGQAYNPRAVARDIRRLYDMGHFSHIEANADADGDGVRITYVFQEKRVIDEIKIIGNDKVRTRQIQGVLSWTKGDSFVPDAYDEERDAILRLYASKGFPNATVDINVEEIGTNRVRITYAIKEGKKARIDSISIEGNTVFSDREIRKMLKTRRGWWFVGGKYDEQVFEADLQKIIDEYGNKGRLEAEIVSTEVAASQDSKGLDIVINLSEGPEYHVESLQTAENFVYDNDEVSGIIKVHAGDVHNKGQVEADAALIEKGYLDAGYVNAHVVPQVTLDRDKKTTHVVHRVTEGDLKYIEEINITGNTVTKDEVIRRELMVKPGERFDGPAIDASRNRLENTRYYESLNLNLEDPNEDDPFANLLVDVEEAKTGEFSFGAGYSSEEGMGGFLQLRLDNFDLKNWPTFSGGGQQFTGRISIGEVRNDYNLSFTDPELFGYPLAGGIDLFDESYEYTEGTEYTEHTSGAQMRLAKQLSPFVTARSALRYRYIDISDIPWYANPALQRERGGSTTVSNIWGINRNTVDLRFDPSSGARHDLELEVAGLGGDNEFVKFQHDSQWYWTLDEEKKWVLSFRTREGIAGEYGSSDFVPISDRFFAGGTSTVRGYEQGDIGPKVKRFFFFGEEDAIGGDMRLVQNLEFKYKLGKRFRLYSFMDAGGVWEDTGDFDFGDMRYSIGVGTGVEIPKLGPIRIDYAVPLNPDDDQGNGRWHLQSGFRF